MSFINASGNAKITIGSASSTKIEKGISEDEAERLKNEIRVVKNMNAKLATQNDDLRQENAVLLTQNDDLRHEIALFKAKLGQDSM